MKLPHEAGCFPGSGNSAETYNLTDFSTEQIKIVPHIRTQNTAAQDLPIGIAPDNLDAEDIEIPVADLSEKDCVDLVMLTVNIPGMFGNPHLERSEAQCTPFGRQLHRYCQKKGIDPADYIFDEFGLAVTGAALIGGIWADHKAHKAGKKKQKFDAGLGVQEVMGQPEPKPEEIPKARPEGAKVSMMPSEDENKTEEEEMIR